MQREALVTIVIPSYNYARFLPRAIESAISQSHKSVEIVVIDDGSTDNTSKVVARYKSAVRYHYQENQGLSAARNTGIEFARGRYILFLDADDWLGRNSISPRVEALEASAQASYACCKNRLIHDDIGPVRNWLHNLFRGWNLPTPDTLPASLVFGNIAPPHAYLVRLSTIRELGLKFDTGMRACEDYDFWFRLMCLTRPPLTVAKGLVYYRKHTSSMSANLPRQTRYDALMLTRVYKAYSTGKLPGEQSESEYAFAIACAAVKVLDRLLVCGIQEYQGQVRKILGETVDDLRNGDPNFEAQVSFFSSELRAICAQVQRRGTSEDRLRAEELLCLAKPKRFMTPYYALTRISKCQELPHFWNILYQDMRCLRIKNSFSGDSSMS